MIAYLIISYMFMLVIDAYFSIRGGSQLSIGELIFAPIVAPFYALLILLLSIGWIVR